MPETTPSKATSASTIRLDFIDGCRGLAVCCVILFHALIWSRANVPHMLGEFAAMVGRGSVDLFLVISGFCLTWPLVGRTLGSVSILKLRSFAVRRISRIYPPYLVAIGIAVAFNSGMQHASPRWFNGPFCDVFDQTPWRVVGSLISHLALLHGFTPYHHDIDGAFWSLSLEWQFYILFPLLAWVARKWGAGSAFLLTLTITLTFRTIVKLCGAAYIYMAYYNETALARWCEFGLGMLIAVQVARPREKRWAKDWLVLIVFLITVSIGLKRPAFFLAPVLWGALGGSIVYVASKSGTITNRATSSRFLMWVGDRSYSLYLIHGSVFMGVSLLIGYLKIVSPGWTTFMFFVPGISLAFVAGMLMYRVVEWPMLKKRVTSGIANVALPPLTNDGPVALVGVSQGV